MKRVLYISNIEVPYRVRFFNELARHCDLTVLYERERSTNRDAQWALSQERAYRVRYLKGRDLGGEYRLSLGILRELKGYDAVIVGCYNSPSQMLAILALRLRRQVYLINLDGEPFLEGGGLKGMMKRFFLKKATKYLVAGEKAAASVEKVAKGRPVIPYYFSSLTAGELSDHALAACPREDRVLVVGQYFDYKGMDVALAAARLDPGIPYTFVGMGGRTELFQKEQAVPENVEAIPFLQKQELEEQYKSCGLLLLPTRQECWGLVVNEAASFGTPIVSTWGSGAAVEFFGDAFPQYLAQPGDPESLLTAIRRLRSADPGAFSRHLLEKSRAYHIEHSVQAHLEALEIEG